MQHFIDSILVSSASGMRPMGNASVTVYQGGTTVPATIYSDDGVTPLENPFFSGPEGGIAFYAADGRYDIRIAHPLYPTSWVRDVLFQDYIGDPLVRASDLATVAFTGAYLDLIGRPTLGSAAAASVSDFATAAQGGLADSAIQPGALAVVATSGDYDDLLNKPSIPSGQVPADWDAAMGVSRILNKPTLGTAAAMSATAFATALQGSKADTAVQPSDLATVATSGDYDDLSNKPSIPSAPVNADWNSSSGLSEILNKPTLGTAAAMNASAFATAAQGTLANTAVQPGDLGSLATQDTVTIIDIDATGTPSATTYLRGDGTWETPAGGGGGGIPDAPVDGQSYARNNAAWEQLAPVAISGSYDDLLNRPTLGTAAAASTGDFASAAQGTKADTAVQPGALATVATSGDYDDLLSKPSIPAAQVNADWNAVTGVAVILNKPVLGSAAAASTADFATAAQGSKADTAVQPGALATVATTGAYADLGGKPGNATTAVSGFMAAADKTKLDGVATGATNTAAPVNADWNAASGLAQIQNKPATIGQAEAEAGTATTVRMFTSQRVRQNVIAYVGPILGDIQNALDAINGV